jgi:hypothetical protein
MRPRKNASYLSAGFYSALLTMFGGSWYFLLSLLFAMTNHGDLGKVVADTIVGCFVCWIICTFMFYEVGKMFDDMNEAGRRRLEDEQRDRNRSDEDNNDKTGR